MTSHSILFRQAVTADIPAMSAIRLAVRENILSDPSRVTVQMYEDYLALLGRGWVAEVDGEVVGFSYAASDEASIWALFMDERYEGRGIAKQLLQLAVDWLFEQGNDVVQLSTSRATRAERFYARLGWTSQVLNERNVEFRLARAAVIRQP